jgi:hypothetical protein
MQTLAQRHFMQHYNALHTWAMMPNADEFIVLKKVGPLQTAPPPPLWVWVLGCGVGVEGRLFRLPARAVYPAGALRFDASVWVRTRGCSPASLWLLLWVFVPSTTTLRTTPARTCHCRPEWLAWACSGYSSGTGVPGTLRTRR